MAASTAQTYVSAVNTVMSIATKGEWKSVSPTKDCQIAQRCAIRQDVPGALDRDKYAEAAQAVRDQVSERAATVVDLCRDFGLRSKEASLINAKNAFVEAKERGAVTISDGTKGGREREVPITSERQLETLAKAAEVQGADRSMIPVAESWKTWREGELRDFREVVKEHTGGGLHDLRAAYACERYQQITGFPAPVAGGGADRATDRAAREILTAELGHGRIDVVNEYIGAWKA